MLKLLSVHRIFKIFKAINLPSRILDHPVSNLRKIHNHFSLSASFRNFGSRIARIFTRKKNRSFENSQAVNEKNQKSSICSTKETPSRALAVDSKYVINALNDSTITDENFQRCTSYSPKSRNRILPQIIEPTGSFDLESETDLNNLDRTAAHMDGKLKDVNQLYKEMEEAVALKVRETMELADARRRAVAQGTLTRKEIASFIENVKSRLPNVLETTQKSINTLEDNNKYDIIDKDLPQKQETKIEVQVKPDHNKNVEIIEAHVEKIDTDIPASRIEDGQIGFEHFETSANIENVPHNPQMDLAIGALSLAQNSMRNPVLYENVKIVLLESTPSLDDRKIGFQRFEELSMNPSFDQPKGEVEENKLEIAQGALALAQNAVRNTDTSLSRETTSDVISDVSNGRNNNNPFEIDANDELRLFGEKALVLAESAMKNSDKNPFQSSDDEEEIQSLSDNTSSVWQTDSTNKPTNPFNIIGDEPEIVQSGVNHFAKNPFQSFHEDQEEMKQLGADALSIAQSGAMKINTLNRQASENSEDIENAFNSLLDSELYEPLIKIGFDNIEEE